jgi:tetratricopeptide (TPR) repeat protein
MERAMFGLELEGHASLRATGGRNPKTLERLERARMYYQLAKEKGSDSAELESSYLLLNESLGNCYYATGRYRKAVDCFIIANTPNANVYLGILASGYYCEMTEDELNEAFERLIDTLHSDGIDDNDELSAEGFYALGMMYQDAIGTQQSIENAYNCFVQSENLGFAPATDALRNYREKVFGGVEFLGE